ncbi:MAG TPA: hypothetical protein V6D06_11585 [Trichocoleus sp.]
MNQNLIVIDTEIANPIASDWLVKKHPKITQWAKDWNDFEGMGLACACVWDYRQQRFQVFADNLPNRYPIADLADYLKGKTVVAFKGDFDSALLAANGVKCTVDYDLLMEIRVAAGLPAEWSPEEKGLAMSYKLDTMAWVNLGHGAWGSGADCPIDWQYGKKPQVIAKCISDVAITRDLFDRRTRLVDPNTGDCLNLPISPVATIVKF